MKSITQKQIRNQLIKIIKKEQIEEVMYEPRYKIIYDEKHLVIGSIITIRTLNKIKK